MRISPEYCELNRELHHRVPSYGAGGHKWRDQLLELAKDTNASSVLDYGCGKGSLLESLADDSLSIAGYDPAVEGMESDPQPADIVICTDVLEHVEEECLDEVLAHIMGLARKAVILGISCKVGGKTLADGRPAHILVRPPEWWRERLSHFGLFIRIASGPDEFNVVAAL